jgi:hypothetical protein
VQRTKTSILLLEWMRERFNELQSSFGTIRHSSACSPYDRSCKEYKCRKNFPNYDLVIRSLLVLAEYSGSFGTGHAISFLRFFPGLKTPSKVTTFVCFFSKMLKETKWDWLPDDDELLELFQLHLIEG